MESVNRWPRGSPRLTSNPLRTMNGLRRRTVESGAGTSMCQPVRSRPLKSDCGWRSDAQREVEPSAAAIVRAIGRKATMILRFIAVQTLFLRQSSGRARGWSQLPDPDIQIADRSAMVLEHDRLFCAVFLIRLHADIGGGAPDLDVILDEHTVVNNGNGAWRHYRPILAKPQRSEEDVVRLPLARFSARVHERDVLLVNARSLAVRIRSIVV